MGWQGEIIYLPLSDDTKIHAQLPCNFHHVHHIGKVHGVCQIHTPIFIGCPDGTRHIFVLQQTGMGSAVRIDQSVHAEIPLHRELAEITPVVEFFLPLGGHAHVYTVVAPLPDKRTHEAVITVHQVKIILQVSGAVSHGMTEFTQNKRFFLTMPAVLLRFRHRHIHAAVYIDIRQIIGVVRGLINTAFVVDKILRVLGFDPLCRLFHVNAKARLISQGPHEHTALILIPGHKPLYPVHDCLFVYGIAAQETECGAKDDLVTIIIVGASAGIEKFRVVGLQIGLVYNVKTQLIVQLIGPGCIGIMACTNGIDIMGLH